ncbi:MAG: Maf family protein, partial [Planctomycetota bacterium]
SVAGLAGDGWVLAADTIAALGGRVFGKPADRDDARRILKSLSGTTHQVITGVTLLDASSGVRLIRHDSTNVIMRRLTDSEIEDYLDSGAWEGKAGAYGIQDKGDAFVERIEGSFTNVVGLPMELVARMLDEFARNAP